MNDEIEILCCTFFMKKSLQIKETIYQNNEIWSWWNYDSWKQLDHQWRRWKRWRRLHMRGWDQGTVNVKVRVQLTERWKIWKYFSHRSPHCCYCSKLVITDLIDVTVQDKNNPKWITHKVIVLQRPQIVTSHSRANLTVIKGKVIGGRG